MRIVCEKLGKAYTSRRPTVHALHDVSLTVADGEFVCVIGSSGCGKTTLLKLIAGLLTPTTGTVRFDDRPDDGRPATALVFQQHGLFPWMTVIDNVAFGLRMHGVSRRERRERASAAAIDVGLGGFLDRFPHELSAGMRQRVNIARALLANPHVLLMDEPFASLDALTTLALREELLLTWSARRCGVLYVTHDLEEAVQVGDRIIVLAGGDRQGGTVAEEIPVPLSRPRDLVSGPPPEAAEITRRMWQILKDDVRRRIDSMT
jgi:NitT/TauT family transport system ATP-binding protein